MKNITSRYDILKDKYQKDISLIDTRKEVINNVTTLLKYNNIDEYIPPFQTSQWVQFHLLKQGIMGFGEIEGKLTFARGNFGEGLDKRFGFPEKFIWYTNGGLSGEWTIGKDCVIFPANPAFYPDIFTIDRYCKMLAEIDVSTLCMLWNSRNIPIPVCELDDEREELKDILADIRAGKPAAFASVNVEGVKTLDITAPSLIQYMSNYSLFYDEVIKRLYLHFGIAVENKDKKAQVTTEELDALSQVAGAAFYTRYELQKKAAENANTLFGTNIEVVPGEYFDDLSNGKNEDMAVEEPEEETETVEEGGTENE